MARIGVVDPGVNPLLQQAESVSFVVCTHFGLETAAPMYLAGWSDPKRIKEHSERIIKTAHKIIESVKPSPIEIDD